MDPRHDFQLQNKPPLSSCIPCDHTFKFSCPMKRSLSRAHFCRPMTMDQKFQHLDLVVMLILVFLFCFGSLYWAIFLVFTPDFILNHINSILRYTHELAGHCHCALQYIPQSLKTIFGYCLQGFKVVMPSARGRRVRIADEVSSSFMAYYEIRVDEIILCRSSTRPLIHHAL